MPNIKPGEYKGTTEETEAEKDIKRSMRIEMKEMLKNRKTFEIWPGIFVPKRV